MRSLAVTLAVVALLCGASMQLRDHETAEASVHMPLAPALEPEVSVRSVVHERGLPPVAHRPKAPVARERLHACPIISTACIENPLACLY